MLSASIVQASSRARRWSWPRCGAWTSTCGGWMWVLALLCSPWLAGLIVAVQGLQLYVFLLLIMWLHCCCCCCCRHCGRHRARAVPVFVQAALVVADQNLSLQITGNGDVLEPHDGIIGELGARGSRGSRCCGCGRQAGGYQVLARWRILVLTKRVPPPRRSAPAAIGSGSPYALAAARALIDVEGIDALTIGGCARCAQGCAYYSLPGGACCCTFWAGRLEQLALLHVAAPLPPAPAAPRSQEGDEDCRGCVHLH